MKGEALAFFSVHFFASFGHVGARGAQMTESNFFLRALPVEAFFAMIENRGKKQGFATRSGAKNETTAQKDDLGRRDF